MSEPDFAYSPPGPIEVVERGERMGIDRATWSVDASIGDTMLVDCWNPATPQAVVVIGHGGDGSRTVPYVAGTAAHWARHGFAVVAADAPFHGDRFDSGGMDDVPGADAGLLVRWVRDHRMLLDAVELRFPDLPIGFAGLSMGGLFGVPLAACDDRISTLLVAVAGSTSVSFRQRFPDRAEELAPVLEMTDPMRFAARFAPRPVLMVCAEDDELVPRCATQALFAAFCHPKELAVLPGRHADWRHPAVWHRRMLGFLRRTLMARQ